MAHKFLKRRFNVPYQYYQQGEHDGEDMQFLPVQPLNGFGYEEVKSIINYKGDEYESKSQILFDGDDETALKIRGGDYIENEFMGKLLVQAVRRYYTRMSRSNKPPRIELVVVYL